MGPGSILYLDNNATTAMDPAVLDAMAPYLTGQTGNASSRHALGRRSRKAIDDAVENIARCLNARPEEIVFTSGATESNNLAILGGAGHPGSRVLVSGTEHPSALEPCLSLAARGFAVERLSVDQNGLLAPIENGLTGAESLVVVQLANSETGTLQELPKIRASLPANCRLHVDAVQGVGRVAIDFSALGSDSLAVSGHKIHGPPGVGLLLVRMGFLIDPLLVGGGQQLERRPGTEPVALIVGLAKAIELAIDGQVEYSSRMRALRDEFEGLVFSSLDGVVRNGDSSSRLPNTTNLSFLGTDAQALLIALDLAGVMASAGTACASGALEPSPVLQAMGITGARLETALRFSLSRFTTQEQVERAASVLVDCVGRVRANVASNN